MEGWIFFEKEEKGRKAMKKTIVMTLMAAFVAGVLSGCSNGSVSEQMVVQQTEYSTEEGIGGPSGSFCGLRKKALCRIIFQEQETG